MGFQCSPHSFLLRKTRIDDISLIIIIYLFFCCFQVPNEGKNAPIRALCIKTEVTCPLWSRTSRAPDTTQYMPSPISSSLKRYCVSNLKRNQIQQALSKEYSDFFNNHNDCNTKLLRRTSDCWILKGMRCFENSARHSRSALQKKSRVPIVSTVRQSKIS